MHLMQPQMFENFTKNLFSSSPLFKHIVFRKMCPSGSDSFALNSSEGGVVIPIDLQKVPTHISPSFFPEWEGNSLLSRWTKNTHKKTEGSFNSATKSLYRKHSLNFWVQASRPVKWGFQMSGNWVLYKVTNNSPLMWKRPIFLQRSLLSLRTHTKLDSLIKEV